MMAARTVSAQLGYMIGAVAGGIVLAVAGFGTLGWVLFAGMAFSALLVAGVSDRAQSTRGGHTHRNLSGTCLFGPPRGFCNQAQNGIRGRSWARRQRGRLVIRTLSVVAAALVALGATAASRVGPGRRRRRALRLEVGQPAAPGQHADPDRVRARHRLRRGRVRHAARTENGLSCTGIPTGTTANITDLRAVDADTVIIGSGCVMRRSDDRGENFRRVPFVAREQNCPSPLATFHFPSDQTGYVVLADGSVSKTTDGGQSFGGKREVPGTAAAGGGQAVPTDVFFVNDTTGFATRGRQPLPHDRQRRQLDPGVHAAGRR